MSIPSASRGTALGNVIASEKTQIEAGEVYEHVDKFPIESGGDSTPEILAALRACYAVRKTEVLNRLANELRYFGYTGSKS